jgi:hypothetical protein
MPQKRRKKERNILAILFRKSSLGGGRWHKQCIHMLVNVKMAK